MEYGETVEKIMSSGAEVVFNTIVPPGVVPFFQQLHDAGFQKRGGQLICTYFDENLLACCRPSNGRPLRLPRLLPERQRSLQQGSCSAATTSASPASEQFTGGSACSGLYRGMKLWEAAVKEAGSLRQEDVIAALDHAKIAEGPGGPAEMVPGQHHVRMNMYIAQAKNGRFEIVKNLGAIDPNEATVPSAAEFEASQPGRMHEMSVPSPINESLLSQRLSALGSARSWAPDVLPGLERFIRTAERL